MFVLFLRSGRYLTWSSSEDNEAINAGCGMLRAKGLLRSEPTLISVTRCKHLENLHSYRINNGEWPRYLQLSVSVKVSFVRCRICYRKPMNMTSDFNNRRSTSYFWIHNKYGLSRCNLCASSVRTYTRTHAHIQMHRPTQTHTHTNARMHIMQYPVHQGWRTVTFIDQLEHTPYYWINDKQKETPMFYQSVNGKDFTDDKIHYSSIQASASTTRTRNNVAA